MLESELVRHVKQANIRLFSRLDDYCATRDDPLFNAGTARWIASAPAHQHFMRSAELEDMLDASAVLKIARLDLASKTYVLTAGFDVFEAPPGTRELDLSAAHLTVALDVMKFRPNVSTARIRDVVESFDLESDPTYKGHDASRIAELFPALRVFESPKLAGEETWKLFFRFCVSETGLGESWIGAQLSHELGALAELDPGRVPYGLLCKSIFSGEPSYFFLSLYRCVEALYAFAGADRLRRSLSLTVGWDRIAAALEDELAWHPREEGSLEALLSTSSEKDLRLVLTACQQDHSDLDGKALLNQAAKRIYWVRNSTVHYRPSQQKVDLDKVDWNQLCCAMTGIVFSTYLHVFGG